LKAVFELKSLRRLEVVGLNDTNVKDISFVSESENLRTRGLCRTPAENVTPLKNCKTLRVLILAFCRELNDIEALRGLTNLEKLDLQWTSVSNIEPLKSSTNLRVLDLSDAGIQSIDAVQNMSKLEELDVSDTHVTDLSPLAGCLQMKKLRLNWSNVLSITALAGLTKLEELDLSNTWVSDLTPLARCQEMRDLDIAYCYGVRDLRVLKKMPHLEKVCIAWRMRWNFTDGFSQRVKDCIEEV